MFLSIIDIDECLNSNHGCQHRCTNERSHFKCACNAGFKLNADEKTCSGTNYTYFILSNFEKMKRDCFIYACRERYKLNAEEKSCSGRITM